MKERPKERQGRGFIFYRWHNRPQVHNDYKFQRVADGLVGHRSAAQWKQLLGSSKYYVAKRHTVGIGTLKTRTTKGHRTHWI